MPQYDVETVLVHEIYTTGALTQIACDVIAELVTITGAPEALEPFFEQIETHDWSDPAVASGRFATPMRMNLGRQMLRPRLREITGVLREATKRALAKQVKQKPN